MPKQREQPALTGRKMSKYSAPTPKPAPVAIQDMVFVAEGDGKFFALGDDERMYYYNSTVHLWFLV